MPSLNYAVTQNDSYFGDTLITVLSCQSEADKLAKVHDQTRSETSDSFSVTPTDAPAAYTTARAFICAIADWSTREYMFAELARI